MSSRQRGGLSLLTVLIILGFFGYVVNSVYLGVISAYYGLMFSEEYSYLIITVPLTILMLVYILLKHFEPVGVSLERLLAFASLFSTSLSLHFLARISNRYGLELDVLSLIMIVWASLMLFFQPKKSSVHIASLALLLLLIPLPRETVDPISYHFSFIAGKIASLATGASFRNSSNSILVVISDSSGVMRAFRIGEACSGIVSFLAVMSVTPIMIYIVFTANISLKKKLLAVVASITSSFVIVFAGNVLRLILILWVTSTVSYQLALEFFHQFPAIFYPAIAVFVGFYTARRLIGRRQLVSNNSNNSDAVFSLPRPRLAWIIAVITLLLSAPIFSVVAHNGEKSIVEATITQVSSFPVLLENATQILLNNTDISVVREMPVPSLSMLLGSSMVKKILVKYNERYYAGYLEIAETPSRFHAWYVCLTYQGYRIIESWRDRGNATVDFMLIERKGQLWLLGSSIYAYPITLEGKPSMAYARISLFKRIVGKDYTKFVVELRKLFNTIKTVKQDRKESVLLSYVLIVSNTMIFVSVVLLLLGFAKWAWNKISWRF